MTHNFEAIFSQAVEQNPASIVITDQDGLIIYVNKKFSNITGYASEEVLGKNPRVLKSGEKSSEEYKELWDTIVNGKTWTGELHNKKKDGTLYWERATITPVTTKEGTRYYLAIKEDITEERRLIQEQDKKKEELERLNKLMVGREVKMVELKKEIERLQSLRP